MLCASVVDERFRQLQSGSHWWHGSKLYFCCCTTAVRVETASLATIPMYMQVLIADWWMWGRMGIWIPSSGKHALPLCVAGVEPGGSLMQDDTAAVSSVLFWYFVPGVLLSCSLIGPSFNHFAASVVAVCRPTPPLPLPYPPLFTLYNSITHSLQR